jgi:hypothetical protein
MERAMEIKNITTEPDTDITTVPDGCGNSPAAVPDKPPC